jgi:hypothetical protein
MVEYSSTPYLLFMAGEYIAIFLMCALISRCCSSAAGCRRSPFIADGWWWMVIKMWFWFFMFAMVKAIVPRYRYDQLMRIGWKVFLPLSLGWVVPFWHAMKFWAFLLAEDKPNSKCLGPTSFWRPLDMAIGQRLIVAAFDRLAPESRGFRLRPRGRPNISCCGTSSRASAWA